MAFRSKLVRGEAQMLARLGTLAGDIYGRSDLAAVFYKARREGVLAKQTKLDEFIDFLVLRRQLLPVELISKEYGKTINRYCVGAPSPFRIAASLRKGGYLSHGTAAYLHGLLSEPFNEIYLNIEQSVKPAGKPELSQVGIDRAFAGKQRLSKLSYKNKDLVVTILAGKNSGRAGVEPMALGEARGIAITSLERTLIDIAVRPAYAGGIHRVLVAYAQARTHVSTERLVSILARLDHTYPYAQPIGFLMQRAGYSKEQYEPLQARVSGFKFYLAHGIKNGKYDDSWQLFYPSDL